MTTPTNPEHQGEPEPPVPGKGASESELEDDIGRTREQLGETEEALAAKMDVKAQAKHTLGAARHRAEDQAEAVRDAATDRRGRPKPAVILSTIVIAAGVVGVVVLLSRRHR